VGAGKCTEGIDVMKSSLLYTLLMGLVLNLCFTTVAQATLVKKTVQAEGTGANLNSAIYDALDEAIGRINGKSIETRKQLDTVEVSEADNDKEAYFIAEAYQKSIKSATKGVVDGYEILSKQKLDNGLWSVTLSVIVVKFQGSDNNRKRIGVIPLRTGKGRFAVNEHPIDPDRVSRVTTQSLVMTLVQSRKFTVLDREYIDEIVGEQGLALSPNTPITEIARLGQEMVADYILVGTLEALVLSQKIVKMQSSGREVTSRQGNVELIVRLIDVSTRQIVFSESLKLRVTDDDLERFGASLSDEGPESAIGTFAADQVGRKILDTIYPLLIVAVQGQEVTVGQGGSQIKQGDKLAVFMYGGRLTDPYTKEFIGFEEIQVGLIEVTRVNPKHTLARIVESSMDIGAAFEPRKFICRSVERTASSDKAIREQQRKQRDNRSKERDKSW
jgi:curli biogenesis system outer membrane secretion channel CsgG